jgi:hypothetical protein
LPPVSTATPDGLFKNTVLAGTASGDSRYAPLPPIMENVPAGEILYRRP